MVKVGRCCAALAFGVAILSLRLAAKEPADYRLGDAVEANWFTPVALRLVEPHRAQQLAAEAAEQVPAVFHFQPEAAHAVERDFLAEFAALRTNFFKAMAAVYRVRKLQASWLGSERFQTLSATFRNQHQEFPRLAELLALWATAQPDIEIETALAQTLRQMMQRRIRAEVVPGDVVLGVKVRLVNPPDADAPTQAIPINSEMLSLSDIAPLSLAREEFARTLESESAASARFLASFLRPNCLLDAEQTRRQREHYVAARLPIRTLNAGQLIARRGEAVSEEILAALEQLRTHNLTPTVVQVTGVSPGKPSATTIVSSWWWLAVGLPLGLVIWWNLRRRRGALLPARVTWLGKDSAVVVGSSGREGVVIPSESVRPSVEVNTWEQRAQRAEQRAEQAQAAWRGAALKQFSIWLKQRFVRQLMTDRELLNNAQRAAAAEMADLERRLDAVHAPLKERLRAYEQRVAELEQLLAAKSTENRELIKASIRLTRLQLEATRSRSGVELN